MNTPHSLQGKVVAVLMADGFEQSEYEKPVAALQQAGAEIKVVSPCSPKVKAWNHDKWGLQVPVDINLDQARSSDFDALLLPGGVMNPDTLRQNEDAVSFVRDFFDEGKPVAAICHGPQLLIEADVVIDRRMTSYPSIRTDLENAGAEWIDQEVVVDQGLVTSRSPKDIPAFNEKMIEEFAEGVPARERRF
jgi:protease I